MKNIKLKNIIKAIIVIANITVIAFLGLYYFSAGEILERADKRAGEALKHAYDLHCDIGRSAVKAKSKNYLEYLQYCNVLTPEEEVVLNSINMPGFYD